jgi:hypothetical protein
MPAMALVMGISLFASRGAKMSVYYTLALAAGVTAISASFVMADYFFSDIYGRSLAESVRWLGWLR